MFLSRFVPVLAFLGIALGPGASAWACPSRGGEAVVDDSDGSKAAALLEAARTLDQSAMKEETKARSETDMARSQRRRASNLREQARLTADLDGQVLLAKAVVADKEAAAADARAKTHTKRAKTLRGRAIQLRAQARQLLGESSMRM